MVQPSGIDELAHQLEVVKKAGRSKNAIGIPDIQRDPSAACPAQAENGRWPRVSSRPRSGRVTSSLETRDRELIAPQGACYSAAFLARRKTPPSMRAAGLALYGCALDGQADVEMCLRPSSLGERESGTAAGRGRRLPRSPKGIYPRARRLNGPEPRAAQTSRPRLNRIGCFKRRDPIAHWPECARISTPPWRRRSARFSPSRQDA